MGGFTPPRVLTIQRVDQFGGAGRVEGGLLGGGCLIRDDAIDATHADGSFEAAFDDLGAEEAGDEDAVLDDAAI